MADREFSIECLCAEWCGTCREYRPAFDALAARFPRASFRWLDVEDDAEEVGEADVENFPTIVVKRGDAVLFEGVMLPHIEHLARLLEKLMEA